MLPHIILINKSNGFNAVKNVFAVTGDDRLEWICIICGVVGGFFTTLFGGGNEILVTLLIFMAIDIISGILLACVFHKSKKSKDGCLKGEAALQGLTNKGMTILFVVVAHRLDLILKTSYVRDAVVIGFALNELISIVENAGLMGLPLPAVLVRSIEMLRDKSDKET